MYWVALIFFVVGVLMPEIIQHDYFVFREEEVEIMALIICNGMLFFVYLWTDRALRALRVNTRTVLREARTVTKDLSSAYNYIGEMNRKVDIVEHFVTAVVCDDSIKIDNTKVCTMLSETVQQIMRRGSCHVYCINKASGHIICSPHTLRLTKTQCDALKVGNVNVLRAVISESAKSDMRIIYSKQTSSHAVIVVIGGMKEYPSHNSELIEIAVAVALSALKCDTIKSKA